MTVTPLLDSLFFQTAQSHKASVYIFLCVAVLHCYEMAQNQRTQMVLSYSLSVITFHSRIYYYLRIGSRTASSLTTDFRQQHF